MLQTKRLAVRLLHQEPISMGRGARKAHLSTKHFPEILRAKEALQDDKSRGGVARELGAF